MFIKCWFGCRNEGGRVRQHPWAFIGGAIVVVYVFWHSVITMPMCWFLVIELIALWGDAINGESSKNFIQSQFSLSSIEFFNTYSVIVVFSIDRLLKEATWNCCGLGFFYLNILIQCFEHESNIWSCSLVVSVRLRMQEKNCCQCDRCFVLDRSRITGDLPYDRKLSRFKGTKN